MRKVIYLIFSIICLTYPVDGARSAIFYSESSIERKIIEEKKFIEIQNLATQQSLAKSAAKSLTVNYIQIILTLLGTAGLLTTLLLTRSSLKEMKTTTETAQKALTHNEETAKKQLRPYMILQTINYKEYHDYVRFEAIMRNTGQSPAIITNSEIEIFILKLSDEDNIPKNIEPRPSNATIGSNCELIPWGTHYHAYGETLMRRIQAKELGIYVRVTVKYLDIFDEMHETISVMTLSGDQATVNRTFQFYKSPHNKFT